MFLLLMTDDVEPMATPFETWCAAMELHPHDPRSWPLYEATIGTGSHTPAAS